MPCNSCGGPSNPPDLHNGEVPDLLCKVMQRLTTAQIERDMPNDVKAWWDKHQERDRKRINQAMRLARIKEETAKALSKLTPYERSLLKVKI